MLLELKKEFFSFVFQVALVVFAALCFICIVNLGIDASYVITSASHNQMAKLALSGEIVAAPENYNERVYQISIVNEMASIPKTIVIGSSRGMYLGEEITGVDNLYNHCVSGACMEDYYALLGLYERKYSRPPEKVIIEVSPWVFYSGNPEARWLENYTYMSVAEDFYEEINDCKMPVNVKKENPYFSIPYFQYNLSMLLKKGLHAFDGEPAKISTDLTEAADYPDGSIRYRANLENQSKERLAVVQSTNGGVTYVNVNHMTDMSREDILIFERLLDYLKENGSEIIIYMSPFSVTQCEYIYDQGTNSIFLVVENYLRKLAKDKRIKAIGGYDARNYDITDCDFIDFMHLDKTGTEIVWGTDFNK